MTQEQRTKSRDVVMRELMRMLPPEGSEFPIQDRIRWLYAVGYVLMAYHGTSGELRIIELGRAPPLAYELLRKE